VSATAPLSVGYELDTFDDWITDALETALDLIIRFVVPFDLGGRHAGQEVPFDQEACDV
jgi:hypothetical protein